MAQDISGFGSVVSLVASKTFPAGIALTQFADDADPFDQPSVRIGDVAMGLNGDLLTWRKAVPLPITISVVPGSQDDLNLSILANANRVAQGKTSANDVLTLTIVYPDGSIITFANGTITDASFAKSVSSASRLKSMTYQMSFESVNGNA
ncbi:MAG TPA: hypothetical protein VFE62_16095 [Gemmataceae bacterium]|nr:hypothetical protein [Gemmataceae bacterium]